MRNLVTCAEAGRLDALTREGARLTTAQMMEKASLRLWDALKRTMAEVRKFPGFPSGCGIVALCGKGDNGGDAMAMLRHAAFEGGNSLCAIVLETDSVQKDSLHALGIPVIDWEKGDRAYALERIESADLILDGILGTGLRNQPRGAALDMIRACNAAGRRGLVVAVDIPSGMGDGMESGRECLHADLTLCLLPLKECLYAPAFARDRGRIVPVGGVFPADGGRAFAASRLLEAGDARNPFAEPSAAAYKTTRGRVAVFAGSRGAAGAARLCAEAALRAGAGYVALFADEDIVPAVSRESMEIMVRPLGTSRFDPEAWDLAIAGPGWGGGEDRRGILSGILRAGLPAILDADAVKLFAELMSEGFRPTAPVILTPHPGEFRSLSGLGSDRSLADPRTALASLGLPESVGVILKSHVTWIMAPGGECAVWEGMESGLAVAGAGDVLAGLAGGLAAAGMAAGEPEAVRRAMESAVAVQGLAGKRLRKRKGWFLAHEIAEEAACILGAPRGREMRPDLDPESGAV